MSEKLKALLAQYGRVAIVVYLTIFVLVFAGAAIGIKMGFSFEGTAGNAGTIAAAYMATKLTQPLRILATVALTPIVAAVLSKLRPPADPEATSSEP